MKITKEQFTEIGVFYIDDFPMDCDDQDFMYNLFRLLPIKLQLEAVEWGFNDTVVRENIHAHVLSCVFDLTYDEYTEQGLHEVPIDKHLVYFKMSLKLDTPMDDKRGS